MREQRGQLPAWGVAWTPTHDAEGPTPERIRCHGCGLSVYFRHEAERPEARRMMTKHAADCRQIDVLVLRVAGDGYEVTHYGPHRADVMRAVGTDTLPTPYTRALTIGDVAAHLRRLNPSKVVMVEEG